MRRKSRETAFKLIYETLFVADSENHELYFEDGLTDEETQFAKEIFSAYTEHKEEIEDLIKQNLKDYAYDRVYKIDLALLLLCITENHYMQLSKAIALNEVLEISKIYSTDKSSSFLNGILKDLLI